MIIIEDLKAKVVKDEPDYSASYEPENSFDYTDKNMKQLLRFEVKPEVKSETNVEDIKPEDITHDLLIETKLKGDSYLYVALKKKYEEYIKEHRKGIKKEMQKNRCKEYRLNNLDKFREYSKKNYHKNKKGDD